MTRLALLGVAALLSAAATMPATAQEVISNPGYCAQFYPNANCQNFGPANPYRGRDTYQSRGGNWYGSNARMMRSHSMGHHPHTAKHRRMH